jgi:serine/threonine protein kinase
MSSRDAHRQLLLGLLALQNGFVTQAQLVAAFGVWSLDKSRSLEEVFVEQKALDEAARSLLAALVERHLASHQQDAEQSLAALPAPVEIRARLRSIADPDLGASLMRLKEGDTARNEPDVTQTLPVTPAGGRFVVLRPHARGGLGKVSVALDSELNRQVALKEIREEYAHDEYNQSRFVQEAEITGQLEHPGIVPVYGLGAYRDGRPYYAMRFVEGESLKTAIETFHGKRTERKLLSSEQAVAFRNLLGRIIAACNAIEYAHSRKVIHRDIKPENIMLGPYGETLVVDWGLAKSLDAGSSNPPATQFERQGSDETLPGSRAKPVKLKGSSGATPTLEGSALGTPAYMSPEQAQGKLAELGPGSDVYSLGASLYVLLTGQAAFKGDEVTELLEKVRSGQFASPRAIWSGVPRPLEAICLKAMAMKSAERYRSARALAEDIERYLADEPVSACVDPILVRARRWMKRHPALTASAAASVILSLTGAIALVVMSQAHAAELAKKNQTIEKQNQSLQEKNTTITSQNQNLESSRKQEEQAKLRAEELSKFMVGIFRSADPKLSGKEIKATDLLDKASEKLQSEFKGDPLAQASILHSIGQSYMGLGEPAKAIPLFRKAMEIRRTHVPSPAVESVYSMTQLGNALIEDGQIQEGKAVHEETVKYSTETLGADHDATLTAQSKLADAFRQLGQKHKALDLFSKVYTARMRATPEDIGSIYAGNDLALGLVGIGLPNEAAKIYAVVRGQLAAALGPDHSETQICEMNLARAHRFSGNAEEANKIVERLVALRTATLGVDHPDTLTAQEELAQGLIALNKYSEAAVIFEAVLPRLEQRYGRGHWSPLSTKASLASAHFNLGDVAKAKTQLEEVLELAKASPETCAGVLSDAADSYAYIDFSAKRYAQAAAIFRSAEAVLMMNPKSPPGPLRQVRDNLANTLRMAGDFPAAIEVGEQNCKDVSKDNDADSFEVLSAQSDLGFSYYCAGRLQDAISTWEKISGLLDTQFTSYHSESFSTKFTLITAYLDDGALDKADIKSRELVQSANEGALREGQRSNALAARAEVLLVAGKFAEALPLAEQCLELRKIAAPNTMWPDQALGLQGWANLGLKKYDLAEKQLIPAVEQLWAKADDIPPGFRTRIRRLTEQVIALCEAQGKTDEAAKWRKKLEDLKDRF